MTPFEDRRQQHGVDHVHSSQGSQHATSSALSEAKEIERHRAYLWQFMGQTQGCIDHFHNKACKKCVVTRDEGGHGVITIAVGLWVDEEREVLWWQHPCKLVEMSANVKNAFAASCQEERQVSGIIDGGL